MKKPESHEAHPNHHLSPVAEAATRKRRTNAGTRLAAVPLKSDRVLIEALSGDAPVVSKQLHRFTASKTVVAFAFEGIDEGKQSRLVDTVNTVLNLVSSRLADVDRGSLDTLVNTLIPREIPSPIVLVEAKMQAEAKANVLNSGRWLTGADIGRLAGFSATNLGAQPNKWKQKGQIFVITHQGQDYYPDYALDPDNGYRPRPAMKAILDVFDGTRSSWELAYWFHSINSGLDDKAPFEMLAEAPERVIQAAQHEIEPILHG
ncbi:MAG: hypothetical protein QM674_06030 [Burkholderiaceae bacterium]